MQFIRYSQISRKILNPTVAMIGTFDGFHRGHQTLLQALKNAASALGLPSLVILFEPQPSEYFLKKQAPARLMSLREKLIFLKDQHIDYVCCLPFNKSFSMLTAHAFANHYIHRLFQCKKIILGQDFRFGTDRQGDVKLLSELGNDYGFTVEVIPEQYVQDSRISSTQIRIALADGDLALARACLGRYYSVQGRIVHGQGLARQWGIPTANVHLAGRNLAIRGIFQVYVFYKEKQYPGVASIGIRPTTHSEGALTLEVHVFDWNKTLYGEYLEVIFLEKIRDEKQFDTIELLVEQIYKDIEIVKSMKFAFRDGT